MRHKLTKKKSTARKAPAKAAPYKKRRRISGTGFNIQGMAMKIVALGAGSVGARALNAILVKMKPNLSPTMSGVIQIAAGVLLPYVIKGNKFIADMSDGAIANGVMVTAVSLGVISGTGIGAVGRGTMRYRVNGYPGFNAMAGYPDFKIVSGTPEFNTMAGNYGTVTAPPMMARKRTSEFRFV